MSLPRDAFGATALFRGKLVTRLLVEMDRGVLVMRGAQGYLGHKKEPPPHETTIGSWV